MGFFQTLITGYKIWGQQIAFTVKNNSDKILGATGTGIMMIGAGLFAKTAAQEETRQAIAEADKVIAECKASVEKAKADGAEKTEVKAAKKKYYKARLKKLGAVVKIYRRPLATEVVGVAVTVSGFVDGRKKLATATAATAAVSTEFMDYRKNVIADLGPDADRKYLTSKIQEATVEEVVDDETGEITKIATPGGLVLDKDPSVFKFWFSEETCPSIWEANYDLRIAKLRHLQDEYDIKLRTNGHLTLNDQRRAFAYNPYKPGEMDVGIGGIMGRLWEPGNPEYPNRSKGLNWHFEEDENFMNGVTTGTWIIFDVEEEPIANKMNRKLTQVESRRG